MPPLSDLTSQKQSPNALKTLNGIRVLSLFWVIVGHVLLYHIFTAPANFFEIADHLIQENPNLIWLSNATPSVDSFFVIGGLLTGYLMKRTFDKVGKFDFIMFFMAILNRTLRLMPTIMVAVLSMIVFFQHTGAQDEQNMAFMDWPHFSDGYFWNQAQNCVENWYLNLFNVMWLDASKQCLGQLWYVSCDYWFFIISLLLLMGFFKSEKSRKISYWLTGAMCTGSLAFDLWVAVVKNQQFNVTFIKTQPNGTDQYPGNEWVENYFRPWSRCTPYFLGVIAGYWLVEARHNVSKVNWLYHVKVISLSLLLIGVIYFPLPNYYEPLFWPRWVGYAYTGLNRAFWGLFLAALIYYLEIYRTGWIYQILSNDYWLLLSKLNFSAYLYHMHVNTIVHEYVIHRMYFLTPLEAIMIGIAITVLSYGVAAFTYVIAEYPLSVLAKRIMEWVQGSMAQKGKQAKA